MLKVDLKQQVALHKILSFHTQFTLGYPQITCHFGQCFLTRARSKGLSLSLLQVSNKVADWIDSCILQHHGDNGLWVLGCKPNKVDIWQVDYLASLTQKVGQKLKYM